MGHHAVIGIQIEKQTLFSEPIVGFGLAALARRWRNFSFLNRLKNPAAKSFVSAPAWDQRQPAGYCETLDWPKISRSSTFMFCEPWPKPAGLVSPRLSVTTKRSKRTSWTGVENMTLLQPHSTSCCGNGN